MNIGFWNRFELRRASLFVVTSLLVGSWAPGVFAAASPVVGGGAGAITVSGSYLLRDGAVWTPHGLVSIAFVAPPAAQQGVFVNAYKHFSKDELAAMRAWGADTVRIQVSQPGLDPQNPLFTQSFVATVGAAVREARAAGLSVIVSVQDESQSGESNPASLPNEATQRVWQVLAPLFNRDTGILYELINEPQLPVNVANWAAWARSMDAVIMTIRNTGSRNVVVADGLNFAERLDGAPSLTDPLYQVAYAAHPYAHNAAGQTEQIWERNFGSAARTVPVIITEWTTVPKYYCDMNTAVSALAFLHFLQARGIGLTAFAYDFGANRFGSVVQDFKGTPSTFAGGLQCGQPGFGPGTLVQDWYETGFVPNQTE